MLKKECLAAPTSCKALLRLAVLTEFSKTLTTGLQYPQHVKSFWERISGDLQQQTSPRSATKPWAPSRTTDPNPNLVFSSGFQWISSGFHVVSGLQGNAGALPSPCAWRHRSCCEASDKWQRQSCPHSAVRRWCDMPGLGPLTLSHLCSYLISAPIQIPNFSNHFFFVSSSICLCAIIYLSFWCKKIYIYSLPIHPSIHPLNSSFCLPIRPQNLRVGLRICLSIDVSIDLSIYLSIYLPIYLSIHLCAFFLSIYRSISRSLRLHYDLTYLTTHLTPASILMSSSKSTASPTALWQHTSACLSIYLQLYLSQS